MPPIIDFPNVPVGSEYTYYLDTNIPYALYSGSSDYGAAMQQEIEVTIRRVIAGDGLLITSALTIDEITNIVRKNLYLDKRYKVKDRFISMGDFYKQNPAYLPNVYSERDRICQALQNNVLVVPVIKNEEWYGLENQVGTTLNMDVYDSGHLISAKSMGAPIFMTADKDYLRINDAGLTICVPSANYSEYTATGTINYSIPIHTATEDMQ